MPCSCAQEVGGETHTGGQVQKTCPELGQMGDRWTRATKETNAELVTSWWGESEDGDKDRAYGLAVVGGGQVNVPGSSR